MAETELTKRIKVSLRDYVPRLKSNMRTVRWAEEVNVLGGYVDVIRFEDYISEDKSFCYADKCKLECFSYPNENCKGCVFKKTEHVLDICCTCFEVKISKSDFKSKNGHNFVGNFNYYVIPKELFSKIENLVPEGIGVITFNEKGSLRKKVECKFKEVSKDDMCIYLYNAMKKWVDGYKFGGRVMPYQDKV